MTGQEQQAGSQPDFTGACMIALYPPPEVAEQLAVDGGLDPADMHVTIAYLGDSAGISAAAVNSAAASLAARPPLAATVSGHARFTGGDGGDAIVAIVDSPALDVLRRDAEEALAAAGIEIASAHGFTAHMTLCYQDPGDPDPVGRIGPVPVTFAGVSAQHAAQRTTYPFSAAPADAAPRPASGWDRALALAGAR
jgi:2'-5' RNA ligase